MYGDVINFDLLIVYAYHTTEYNLWPKIIVRTTIDFVQCKNENVYDEI